MTMLPAVTMATPPEPYSAPVNSTGCAPTPKPGVVAFRDFVMEHLGGRDSGITRPCEDGQASQHHEGRAWDWGMSAFDPGDATAVQELFDWLFASDPVSGEPHANFRRLGLRYLIWDRQIWSAGKKAWHPYDGASPHTDHVHFSFSWPGALAQTSFFEWLAGGGAVEPPPPPGPPTGQPWRLVAAMTAGAVAGWLVVSRLFR